jgi:glycerophosphoryl diester phosphodiesterase
MHKKIIQIIICGILVASGTRAQDSPLETPFTFVGHRGASYLAPENTRASMVLAWESGADAAECDVMLTSDQQVILCHDKNTKNLTGESFNVNETPWEQLKNLSVRLKDSNLPEYAGEPIPLLEDIVPLIPAHQMLVIEIKTGPEILPHLQEVIEAHWKTGKISFIAFDFETIKATKALFPGISCYYLSMLKSDYNKQFDKVVEANLDGMDLRHSMIDRSLVEQCNSVGLDVWCWTVNDPEIAMKMKDMGVTAVTTDRPAWLKANL